jgi:hypothetical protein
MVILCVVGAVVLAALLVPVKPRFTRWRGAEWDSMEAVQEEHLRLFTPRDDGEE